MKVLVFSSNPNTDGLTAECARAAAEGIQNEGGEVGFHPRQSLEPGV